MQALRGIDFTVAAGSVVGFLGPNGAGKTTAMKILTGFLAADAGSARVCGILVEEHPLEAKRRIGYLPENNPLYPEQKVADFLAFAARARGLSGPARRAALERVAERTGLQAVWRRPIGECSKGFRQRVGLAQALVHDPDLLVLDEPTNGLDPLQAAEMRALVRELGESKTVLLTSHVLPEVEALAERAILIHHGRKVADAPLSELGLTGRGLETRVAVRGGRAALEELLQEAGAQWLEAQPHPFGDEGCAAALAEVDGCGGLERIAATAAARRVPLIELAPRAAGLASLFRRLQEDQD
ncbi:MAG TPA: ATP-binding cassette domain-containing protein [Planctomycetota bacterium]